ncbi:hypothetical protein AAG906_013299 [Vitis piasezkii]
MSPELPSLKSVCSTIQREEVRRKVMIRKSIKGKRLDLKCEHRNAPAYIDCCWVLHPNSNQNSQRTRGETRSNLSMRSGRSRQADKMLSKFVGFLLIPIRKQPRYLHTFTTALEISNFHDLWVVDSLVSKTIESKSSMFLHFCNYFRFKNEPPLLTVMFYLHRQGFVRTVLQRRRLVRIFVTWAFLLFLDDRLCKGFQASFSSTNKHSLWHQRLGHPSESVFNKIHPSLPKGTDVCDICHYSKSTRLPFNLSLSKSSEMFELVHSDVWGPFSLSIDGRYYRLCSTTEVAANIEQQSIAPTIQRSNQASVEIIKTYLLHIWLILQRISSVHEPKNFHEANSQPMWRKSMDDELKALEETNTEYCASSTGKHVVGCHWVYRFKFNLDGSIERPKSRVVAQGFTQHFGVDYKETFALLPKCPPSRFCYLFANHGWSLSQMDVKNAFCTANLKKRFNLRTKTKSSSMACQVKFYSEDLSFTRSSADSSLYVQIGQTEKLMMLIYVDDLIISGSNVDSIASRRNSKVNFYLLRDSNMLNSKPANTPFDSKLHLINWGSS